MRRPPKSGPKTPERSPQAGSACLKVGTLCLLVSVGYWSYATSQPSTPLPSEGYILPPHTRAIFDFLLASVITLFGVVVSAVILVIGIVKRVKARAVKK